MGDPTRRIVTSKALAAAYPAVWPSPAALETARWRGTSPPYFKIGKRVYYDLAAIERFFDEALASSANPNDERR